MPTLYSSDAHVIPLRFLDLLTKDNITLLIAVFGFGLSLFNFFKDLWDNRSKLKMVYRSCQVPNNEVDAVRFELSFENGSRLPIAVSRIFFVRDNKKFEFQWLPEPVYFQNTENKDHETTGISFQYSPSIPHTIEGLGAWGGTFYVPLSEHLNYKTLLNSDAEIIAHTNRGIKTFYLTISEDTLRSVPFC